MNPKTINQTLFTRPHQWIVYRHQDGRILAAMIKNKKALKYYQSRPDITSSTLITAFNRSEAWHKGNTALEK